MPKSRSFEQRVTLQALPPLCTVMAVSYALMAFAHAWMLPAGSARIVMIAVAATTSAIAWFTGRSLEVNQKIERYSVFVVLGLVLLIVFNCAMHMGLFRDPEQTPLFALTIAAAGFFVASLLRLAFLIAVIATIWWLLFASIGDFSNATTYGFLIAIASAMSLTVSLARMRNLRRLELERQRATKQVQMIGEDRRAFLQRVLQLLEPGLCAVDAEGYVTLTNAAFATILGSTPEAVTGMALQDVTQGTPLHGLLTTRLRESIDLELYAGRALQLSETRMPAETGVSSGRLIVAIDVSSRRHLEKERSQLLQSVQEAQRLVSLGSASGRMAHDFNNHLAVISGCLELLAIELPGHKHVTAAQDAALEASALSKNLQAMAVEQEHVLEPVDVAALLEECLVVLRAGALRGISFRFTPPADVLVVSADRQQLKQVVFNIAMNAAESYAGGEGVVQLRLERHAAERSPVVGIRVSDDGCGFANETLLALFAPFNSTKGPGRGLGLAASHAIVQKMGGTLDIHSASGAGTSVTIFVPELIESG